LAHPDDARPPVSVDAITFIQEALDEAKQIAVIKALGSEDILLVEGPPGTGKTTFISELISQTLIRNPESRILLTSQTHVALDNAVERLVKVDPSFRIVRLGSSDNIRIADSVKGLLIENKLKAWRDDVLDKGRLYLRQWASRNGISQHHYEVSTRLRTLSSLTRHEGLQLDRIAQLKTEISETAAAKSDPESEENKALLESELKKHVADLKSSKDNKKEMWSKVIELEAGLVELRDAMPVELDEWAETFLPTTPSYIAFRALVETHADWEVRLGRSGDFTTALITSSQVVAGTCIGTAAIKGMRDIPFDLCIVDEASKATPMETLVPMSRARRWVLVGDSKQLPPFVDDQLNDSDATPTFAIDKKQLSETLFGRFEELLPEANRSSLDIQHRMVPAIGNLISECFYDGRLKSAEKAWNPVFSRLRPKPVVWFTTSSYEKRSETRSSVTYSNASYLLWVFCSSRSRIRTYNLDL
jgi:hypothetical protein